MLHNVLMTSLTPLKNMNEINYWENRPFTTIWPEWNQSKKKEITKTKKKRRVRTAFTTNQLLSLEKMYSRSKYINSVERDELAHNLKIDNRIIKIWFQNRRMKEKRESLESSLDSSSDTASIESPAVGTESPSLGPGYPSVGTEYSSVGNEYPLLGTKYPSLGTAYPSGGTAYPSVDTKSPSAGIKYPSTGTKLPSVGSEGDLILPDSQFIEKSSSPLIEPASPLLNVTDDHTNTEPVYQFSQNPDQSYRLPTYYNTNPVQFNYGGMAPNDFPTYFYNDHNVYPNQYYPYDINYLNSGSSGYNQYNSEVNNFWASNPYPYYANL